MIDIWLEAFDKDEITAVIMVDLSAAFDEDHCILLEKLEMYGFAEAELHWMYSYLTERKQRVFVDGALSEPFVLEAAVPKGSFFGPLLYSIFTNDLPEAVHEHLSINNNLYNTHC